MINRFISKPTNIKEIKLLRSKLSCEDFNNIKASVVRTMAINCKNNYEAEFKDKKDFQSVPNVLIATNNDEEFVSLNRKLKNILDPGKVLRVVLFNY